MLSRTVSAFLFTGLLVVSQLRAAPAEPLARVSVQWDKSVRVSKTSVSMEVCVEPPMRRSSPIHDQLFQALHKLGADYARLTPWNPYPRLAVAELEAPRDGKTSWDFSLLDPIVEDFMQATAGHAVMMDISTIPEWMYKTDKPVAYPDNPDEITWTYEKGRELRDPSLKEVTDYWARVAGWYTQGGFRDEYGKWHASGHHYKFDYWEVLNEVEYEHTMTPESYTAVYDAIVQAVHRVAPEMKFVGMGLGPGGPLQRPQFFEYFLNAKNHRAGVGWDGISYHFYAVPAPDETLEMMEHTFYAQAEGFINVVRYIEAIRRRLSPQTETFVDEVGTILPDSRAPQLRQPIPESYWNLSGGMFAYIYAQLARLGIEVVHEAELIDYPGQYAGTTLVDWETGKPNARYWILKLLRENFGRRDKLVESGFTMPPPPNAGDSPDARDYVYAQGFVTPEGKREILLVNKRDRSIEMSIPRGRGAREEYVDQETGFNPAAITTLQGDELTLKGLAVAVVTLAP